MATATKPMMLDETGKQIVDELKKIADIKGSAIGTTFDDSAAHLGTNNVQGAIDKLKSNADTLAGKVTEAEQNIITNSQNIATNTEELSRQSSQIAEISADIKVEKSIVVDDYALVDSGSGVLNDLMLYGRSHQDGTPTPENPSAIRALSGIKTENEDKSESKESAIPTLYGKEVPVGNYTDLEGKKWLSDVLRIERGDIERRFKKVLLGDLNIAYTAETSRFSVTISDKKATANMMCDMFGVFSGSLADMPNNTIRNSPADGTIFFRCDGYTDVAQFKALVKDSVFVYELATPTTDPIPQSVLNSIRQLRSFADKTHIYCDNGSLEAVISENTEVGNAIGRNAIKINEILNILNPVTASVEE